MQQSLHKKGNTMTDNVFHLNTPEINARRGAVKSHMDKVNNVIWDDQEDRTECIRGIFGAVGENPYILDPLYFTAGRNLFLGDNVFINGNVTFIDAAPIEIGDHTMIAPGCVLTTVGHPISAKERRNFTSHAAPIKIGRDVWIGANCTIFPGVTIGDNVVIGANSVVNKDVPSNRVVAGAPVRLIREIEDDTLE